MAFPNQFLEDIRARISLADLVGHRVRLTRKGREHLGLCPFHNEKTPSFTVSEEKGFYHCFGCGAHGDAIAFVMNVEGLSFPEAVEKLAADAGLEVPVETPEAREQARRRADLSDVAEAACVWFEGRLQDASGVAALDYLRGRGLDDTTIARFRLGFAPDGSSGLAAALRAQGITEAQMLEVGLLRRPDDGRAPYPFFRDRVIFPITDRRGRVIAFGGRLMGEAKAAKYINSPDTPLFDKGRTLYNLAAARKAAYEEGRVVVAEGYMDVIALARAGFEASVAPLGTALTEAQIEALWRLAAEPVLCFDGDAAGQRAATRAATRALPLLTPGKSLRIAILPAGADPDSLIAQQGKAAMAAALAAAQPLFEVIWTLEAGVAPLDTPERRADLETRLRRRADEIADPAVRAQYHAALREKLWTMFRGGRAGRRQGGPQGRSGGGRREQPRDDRKLAPQVGAQVRGQDRRAQQAILAALINHPALRDEFLESLDAIAFEPDLDKLRQRLQNLFSERIDLDPAGVRAHFTGSGDERLLQGVLDRQVYVMAGFARPQTPIDDARRGLGHVIGRRVQQRVKHEVEALGRSAAQSASAEDEARVFAAKRDAMERDRQLADIDED